jgi:hypothetical protein
MISRLKFDIGELIEEQFSKFPIYIWESENTTFCDLQMGGGQFIQKIVEWLRKFGHSDENIRRRVFGFSENPFYLGYVMSNPFLIGTFGVYKEDINMKFNVIVSNSPYQIQVGPNKTEPIWDKFVKKSFELTKDGGYISLIHPAGWRNVSGRFTDIRDLLLSNQLEYLSIHNEKDGLKVFGAETRYDWYVLKKVNNTSVSTVRFQDNLVLEVDLRGLNFLPNSDFEKVKSLIARDGEERVDVLYSSSDYEIRHAHMNKKENDEFKYPCVYTVNSENEPTFYYSNTNKNGHFGISKLIWSNGRISSIGSYVDETGEFGLTQFSYAIVDVPENLPLIKHAFDSVEFRNLMESCAVGQLTVNYKIISTFRKDFWKEFI